MGIKRFIASKDATITNAYKSDLITRATSSNMGEADTMEVFHIYGQASAASSELSRILIEFPIDSISSARTAGRLPESGSVRFHLNLYNARHSNTAPRQSTLIALPVSSSWSEGIGIDMEEYSNVDQVNWVARNNTKLTASTSIICTDENASTTLDGKYFTIYDGENNGYHVWYNVAGGTSDPNPSNTTGIEITTVNVADPAATVAAGTVTDLMLNTTFTNNFTLLAGPPAAEIRIESKTAGFATNTSAGTSGFSVTINASGSNWTPWLTHGGDFITSSTQNFVSTTASAYLDKGTEDLAIDITPTVEQWIKGKAGGGYENNGLCVMLSSSHEIDSTSYYTKKFFTRGSEFFNRRPYIEARWDSSKKDNRGNFLVSSSMISSEENINTLYLYNFVRGQLRDIPDLGTIGAVPKLKIAIKDAKSGGNTKTIVDPRKFETSALTASWVATGIYSASFAINTTASTLYDVWYTGSTSFSTGTFSLNSHTAYANNLTPTYVSNITNLKPVYYKNEEPSLRLYARNKNWCPTIYTIASKNIATTPIDNAYYKVVRVIDDLEIISYGTGSANKEYSRLSYDVSGNYFNLDMSLFEPGYMYGIKFAYYINNDYQEQPEIFKFRVESTGTAKL